MSSDGGHDPGALGPVCTPTLHIHPSDYCNLRCAHCYSRSDPGGGLRLPVETLRDAIVDASRLGFRVVSFSGGEPLLYPGLEELMAVAHTLGMATTVVTNGYPLRHSRYRATLDNADIVALSVDGMRETHERLRAKRGAWRAFQDALSFLASRGRPFGVIATATAESWWQLEEVAEIAAAAGASLFQIHPIEAVGRGSELPSAMLLSEEDKLRLFLLSHHLSASHAERMAIQLDLAHRDWLLGFPERFYVAGPVGDPPPPSVMVVQADGLVVPISHGMHRRFAITDLRERSLADAWSGFLSDRYPALLDMCDWLFRRYTESSALPHVFDWHDLVVRASHQPW